VLGTLLDNRFSPDVAEFVRHLVVLRWSDADDLPDVIEQLGRDAALAVAANQGELPKVESELFDLVDTFNRADTEVREFLSDPENDAAMRQGLIDKLLSGRVDPVTLVLARRVTKNLQHQRFTDALNSLGDAIAARRARQVAQVTSAVPLTEAQKAKLEKILQRKYGHAVEVYVSIDPDIIGGLRIVIGPDVIDDTIIARLAHARTAMVS
jgi:F-type H+-transporting ATPase subunit delta